MITDKMIPVKIFLISLLILSVMGFLSGCEKKPQKRMTLLIRMMKQQEYWFRKNIKKFEEDYEKKHGEKLVIDVSRYTSMEDISFMVDLEKRQGRKTIGLIKTQKEMLVPMVERGFYIPMSQIKGYNEKTFMDTFLPEAIQLATVNGDIYYIPRKLETNTMVYLKSQVKDSFENWETYRNDINKMLKNENGYGLPGDYVLEEEPHLWDYYDLAVVSYYWKMKYGSGRMAHRAKRYEGTVTEFATKIFQLGGSQKDLLEMDTEPVRDFFIWEAFYRKYGLYNENMWEQGWSGGNIWDGYSKGEVFLAFMHQIDSFFLHGVTDDKGLPVEGMTGKLKNADDMGIAIMPEGVSLELDGSGKPLRTGGHKSNLSGWCWGIPVTTPDPDLSYELAMWLSDYENQIAESSTFGMMPVRKDVVEKLKESFKEEWKRNIFEAGIKQLAAGVEELPAVLEWPSMGQVYLDAWYGIVVNSSVSGSAAIIAELKPYEDKVKAAGSEQEKEININPSEGFALGFIVAAACLVLTFIIAFFIYAIRLKRNAVPNIKIDFKETVIKEWFSICMITPCFLYLFGFFLILTFYLISLSLGKYSSHILQAFPTLINYKLFFTDKEFTKALFYTLGFVAVATPLQLLLGLFVAIILNNSILESKSRPIGLLRGFLRSLSMLPIAIPTLVTAILLFSLKDTTGIINGILMGKYPLTVAIVHSPVNLDTAWISLGLSILGKIWRDFPISMLILLAGLQSISKDQYEAAETMGASSLQTFFYITVPSLLPAISTVLLLRSIEAWKEFIFPYIIAPNAPILGVMIDRAYHDAKNDGLAAVAGIVLILCIILSTTFLSILLKKINNYLKKA
ncbi:MAG: extracellular solute-binding protein [Candidatus Eremiobacterota bacterium]